MSSSLDYSVWRIFGLGGLSKSTHSHFTSGVVIGGWSNQRAVGVQTVLVNGGFVVQDGELILDAP